MGEGEAPAEVTTPGERDAHDPGRAKVDALLLNRVWQASQDSPNWMQRHFYAKKYKKSDFNQSNDDISG